MTQNDRPTGGDLPLAASPTDSPSLVEYHRRSLENVRERLPQAARELAALGVTCVIVEYDGCNDSGQIESIDYLGADSTKIDPSGKVTMSEDALMDLLYDLTQARHPGWENNDGAFGDFSWDVTTNTLIHSHTDRYMEYNTTEHEGL